VIRARRSTSNSPKSRTETAPEVSETRWDAIILGGGPAGLSAALILGRCRRRVILCDTGRPRNAASRALHGFLTRDGIEPAEFLRIGRRQLARYGTVLVRRQAVDARRTDGGFEVDLAGGGRLVARTLLIATGVADRLPPIEGLRALYGRAVFHCPYCDGWEVENRPLAVYGRGRSGMGLALALRTWSRQVA
jgi:thioredoxin reductase